MQVPQVRAEAWFTSSQQAHFQEAAGEELTGCEAGRGTMQVPQVAWEAPLLASQQAHTQAAAAGERGGEAEAEKAEEGGEGAAANRVLALLV